MSSTTDLMSTSDIARAAGVDLSTVSNWRRRFADTFPPPVTSADGGKRARFQRAAVQEWLAANPQLGGASNRASRDLTTLMDMLRSELDVPDAIDLIGAALVLAKAASSRAAMAPALVDAWESIRMDIPADVADLVSDARWDRLSPKRLRDVLETVGDISDAADAYRALLARQSSRFGGYAEQSTPDVLARFLLALAPSSEGTVFDPTAGTGGLLFAAIAEGKAAKGVGVEVNLGALTIARRLAYLSDSSNTTFYLADVISADPVDDLRADLVLCDPPLGVKVPDISYLRRWKYGPPKSSNMDLGWVQICLRHLSEEGTAVVITTPSSLFHGDRPSVEIRSALIRDGVVRAIIQLPGRTRSNTAIPLAVWVLGPPAPERHVVLLVDASDFEHSDLTNDGPIVTAVNGWMANPAASLDPSFAVAMPIRELLTPEVNLLPARFVTTPSEERSPEDWASGVSAEIVTARALLASTAAGDLPIHVAPKEMTREIVSVQDLIRKGTVQFIRGRHWPTDEVEESGPRILNPRALRDAEVEPQRAIDESAAWAAVILPGDVVVVPSADALHAEVWTKEGWVAGSYVDVIRIMDDSLDANYLAAALTHPRNKKVIVASAIRARVDIKELRIPLLPLDAQRRFAWASALLMEREAILQRSLDAVATVRRTLSDAFASAAIDVKGEPR